MKIIADSGSTKCTWLLIDGVHTREVRTRGINAVQHSPGADTRGPCGTSALRCGRSRLFLRRRVRTYVSRRDGEDGPGAVRTFRCGACRSRIGPAGRCAGLVRRGEGVACILGTGSNSCWCRGGEIVENVPPLGYVLGDEGSGAILGRNLVNGIFKGHIPLRDEFLAAHGLTYEEIIRRVYREPYANRFLASFAPFVHAHLDRPDIRDMVARSFADFAGRNLSRYPAHLPVACVGGVAAAFGDLLRETLMRCGREVVTIVRSPAAGLTEYHYGKQNNRTGFGL